MSSEKRNENIQDRQDSISNFGGRQNQPPPNIQQNFGQDHGSQKDNKDKLKFSKQDQDNTDGEKHQDVDNEEDDYEDQENVAQPKKNQKENKDYGDEPRR